MQNFVHARITSTQLHHFLGCFLSSSVPKGGSCISAYMGIFPLYLWGCSTALSSLTLSICPGRAAQNNGLWQSGDVITPWPHARSHASSHDSINSPQLDCKYRAESHGNQNPLTKIDLSPLGNTFPLVLKIPEQSRVYLSHSSQDEDVPWQWRKQWGSCETLGMVVKWLTIAAPLCSTTVDGSHFHLEDIKQLCDIGLDSSPELLAAWIQTAQVR